MPKLPEIRQNAVAFVHEWKDESGEHAGFALIIKRFAKNEDLRNNVTQCPQVF